MTDTTTPTNEPEVGSAVQVRHNLTTDDGPPDELAGLHGTITGRDPFGGYLIKIGHRKPVHMARHAFIVTAAPTDQKAQDSAPWEYPQDMPLGSTSAIAPEAVRLVNEAPLQAINSLTNPRRRRGLDIDSLRTLADSITAHGLAQPILVRPLPASRLMDTSAMDPRPAYEVVAGERRWRAAQMAELPTMPMLVRDLSDAAVLEIQLVENIEREDIDPMEEAEGFALLREKLGYTVEQIAERMGKGRGPSYVRKRMKLLDLTPASREAMFDGTLQLSTGLLVSRYPAQQQAEAVRIIQSLERKGPHGERVHAPFREVVNALYRKLHLLLAQAPFDQEDPGLVMTAGPCSTCAKRTGTNADLFGEAEQGQPLTITVDGKEMPLTISKSYTVSLHEKASLRKDLSAWRGRDFTDEEAKAFDISKLVGAYCMVNVTTSESNGKTYSNVAGLTPLPAALKNSKPAPVHDNVLFDLDNPDMAVFATFHEKLQEAIKRSPEWAAMHGTSRREVGAAPSGFDDMDSDLPPF